MESSYFFSQVAENFESKSWFQAMKEYSNTKHIQTYTVDRPLGGSKLNYEFEKVLVWLVPGHKILFLNLSDEESDELEEYVADFIEELSYRSLRFEYNNILGSSRKWKKEYTKIKKISEIDFSNLDDFLHTVRFNDTDGQRKSDLIISLVINSINSINQVGLDVPESLLDKVRQKIVLFDGDQTRFIFERVDKQRVTIQGLAGTGKTELLLHKLKELYASGEGNRIAFTCHSKTLNASLKSRVPKFFDFMKVDEQIEWNEKLWVFPSWGSESDPTTGLYSFICKKYSIPFYRFSRDTSFNQVCRMALKELEQRGEEVEPCFDYILIDESQDFTESFFLLCEKVARKSIFVAGDIFQNITDNSLHEVHPDYLLNRCYRTDPKTLMFAHAAGMALFERPVIRWLSDEEWEACGYQHTALAVDGREEYILTREPIRRFEDSEDYASEAMKIVKMPGADFSSTVVNIIAEIKEKHTTVKPDDIAVVFLDANNENYEYMDQLAIKINNSFGWKVSKAYEEKEIIKDKVFLSNKFNIKGLEFPFLICISNTQMSKNISFRNTLYMTLTRSFITSYLVIGEKHLYEREKQSVLRLEEGLKLINQENKMRVIRPSTEEILVDSEQLILQDKRYKSRNEIINEIFDELKIPMQQRESLKATVQALSADNNDWERLREIIISSARFL